MFDIKITFEKHIRSISSTVAQNVGFLRKMSTIFGDQDILLKCYNFFILFLLGVLLPIWSSGADSYLKRLGKNL